MSDTAPVREWRFYLDDMVRFCEKICTFTDGVSQSQFVADVMRYDAMAQTLP